MRIVRMVAHGGWQFGLVVLIAGSLQAQERRSGLISGQVSDSMHNALPGATIRVLDRELSVTSDREGRFILAGLPPAQYRITVRYIGFRPDTLPVAVPAGGEVRLAVVMQRLPASLAEITVMSARPRGEAQALTAQKSNDNIVNVMPAELITSLPNTNVADAVGRLPGVTLERDEGEGKYVQIRGTDPRLSNLTIDGVHIPSPEGGVRNIKLDVIPSDLAGTIELYKTLSADQDADAIGGSVNLVTKTPGDRPFATITGEGGYTNTQQGRGLYQFTGTVGGRFGTDKRFGAILGGTYDWNGRGIDDIEPSPGTNDFGSGPVPVVSGVDYREYRYDRSRYGFAGGLDYRLGSGASLYLRGLFADFKNYGTRWATSPSAGDFLTPTTTDSNGNISRTVQDRTPNEQIYSLVGGGRHHVGGVVLEYTGSYAHSRQDRLHQRTTEYVGPSDVAYAVNTTDPYLPTFNVVNGVNVEDPSAFTLDNSSTADERTAAHSVAGRLDLTVPIRLNGADLALKFGGKIRDDRKTQEVADSDYDATSAPVLSMKQVESSFSNPNYYFDAFTHAGYILGPVVDFDVNNAMIAADPTVLGLNVNDTHADSDPNNFTAGERVYATYGMATLRVGRLHLRAGVRLEATRADYTGYVVHFNGAGDWVSTSPVSGSQSYTDVLPSMELRYELADNTNLRAAFGQGISRPNYSDLPPFRVQNDEKAEIDVGNPNLSATRANNFDLMLEHYFATVGVVSAGFFYKDLQHPIYEAVQTQITTGPDAGFTQSQPINGPSAYVWGIELAWQQHLTFLPGVLSGIGILANYSYTYSKATVPGRADQPPLERQAPETWNLGLSYDRGGFSGRIAATHNGASIFAYNFQDGADGGLTGPNGDTYLFPRTQLDAQLGYRLRNGIEFFTQMLNITNEVFGFYNGSQQFPIQREYYGWSTSLGVRLTR